MSHLIERLCATARGKSHAAWLGLALLLPATMLHAEGSRTLFPATYPAAGARAPMDVVNSGSYAGVARNRQFLYVYAQAGEFILLGSRNRSNGGDIFVYNPQGFGTRGNETIPGTGDFTCSSNSPPAGSFGGTGRGTISTRPAELAGPNSADNSATVTDGWSPCAYLAPVTGIYGVRFTGATSGAQSESAVPASNPPRILTSQVSAWEVQVRASADTLLDINGRLFTYAWIGRTGGNGTAGRIFHTLNYVTEDGYRYEQTMNGLDPFAYALYANRAGFLDGGAPLYKSVRGNNQLASTILPAGSGISAQAPQYPIFFSDTSPAGSNNAEVERVLSALGIPAVPPVPELSNVSFTGTVSGDTTSFGAGGLFQFSTVNTLTYQIVISRDAIDFDPANPLNRVLTGNAATGTHTVFWDGRDNAGAFFPVGTNYEYRVDGRNGEVHFPIIDTEGMALGGPTVSKLNGTQDVIVYFDDRGYVTRNGTAVGQLNGHLCGAASAQVQPTPNHSLIGVDSSDSNFNGAGIFYRFYPQVTNDPNNDCNNNANTHFGTAKGLDTWALERTTIISDIVNIVDPIVGVDVGTAVTVDASAFPGQTVFGTLVYFNAGDSAALDTAFTAVVGTPGNCPATVNFTVLPAGVTVASYDPVTCAVTFNGMPTTLSAAGFPGSQLIFEFNYPAPATGPQVVQTTVSASNETANAVAPNSASASTEIIVADVFTEIVVPATVGAGEPVAGTVTFGNLPAATATATGVTYSVIIGTPGDCPADIDFPGIAPATFTLDPATCAVSFSGLDTILDPGESFTLDFTYTAPLAGSVPVSSSIQTPTPESSTANNTANASTLVVSNPGIEVIKTAGVPSGNTAGSTITYTFLVTNTGNVTLTGLVINDPQLDAPATCLTTTLAPTESTTCTGVHTITQAEVNAGEVVNTATATGTPPSGPPVDSPPDGTTTPIPATPAIEVVKTRTDSTDPVIEGSVLDYQIVATNTGNVTLTDVTVTDTLIASLVCAPVTPATLAPGDAVTCTGSYTVTLADVDAGQVLNTATGSGTPPVGPPVTDDDSVTVPIAPNPSLSLIKTAGTPSGNEAGDTITYTFEVTNTGNVTLTGLVINDPQLDAPATCLTTTLAPTESTTCTGVHTITQAEVNAGEVVNTATATGTPPSGPPVNSPPDSTTTPLPRDAALQLVKEALLIDDNGNGLADAGETIEYTLTATNIGNVTLTDVSISDPLIGALACTPAQPVTLAPGEELVCSGSLVVTSAQANSGQPIFNTATAEGTTPTSTILTDSDSAVTPTGGQPLPTPVSVPGPGLPALILLGLALAGLGGRGLAARRMRQP